MFNFNKFKKLKNFKLFINEYVVKRDIAMILVRDRTFSKNLLKNF